jgi:hypothetical protein
VLNRNSHSNVNVLGRFPGIRPRFPYQARQRSWRDDMGRRLIPGTIWKISCHYLFITYFTLTFLQYLSIQFFLKCPFITSVKGGSSYRSSIPTILMIKVASLQISSFLFVGFCFLTLQISFHFVEFRFLTLQISLHFVGFRFLTLVVLSG